jgi:hypothetical protein
MRISRVVTNRNLPCRTMVRTRASKAASTLAARQRWRQAPLQEAQDPKSEPKIAMDVDTESDDTAGGRLVPGELIREGSTAIDRDDDDLVYMSTPVSSEIRSSADTLVTTMDMGSSSREVPP